jgi:polyisoprenoid-binding protein YceI
MAPERFTFDSLRSCVWVHGRSSLHPINTETRGIEGWFEATLSDDGALDLAAPVTGALHLSVDRLSSGNQLYDRELKRRIDARKYPSIEGQILRVASTSGLDTYAVTGDLSFHGKTHTFEHEMTITREGDATIALKGDYVFDIRKFDMKPPSMLMIKVYPEIAVKVELYGTRRPQP